MTKQYALVENINQSMADVIRRANLSLVMVKGHRHGFGAGVIWRKDGIILTNHHVVNRRTPLVVMPDGGEAPAQVVHRDPEVDLAVLQVQMDSLPVAVVVNRDEIKVGQWVFALGHPWGQPGYVTSGVISALNVAQTRGGRSIPILRTDADLAPGNSGGPLLDVFGRVVGINTLILGGDQGIALPAYFADQFVNETMALRQVKAAKMELAV